MELLLVIDDKLVPIKQDIIESADHFAKRIEFLLYALESGRTLERANVLAKCYMNNILYGCTYSSVLETEIQQICKEILITPSANMN